MDTQSAYTPDPLLDSFERYLRAANRSDRTIANYLVSMEQTDHYLRQHGTTLLDARRADLECFLAELLSRSQAQHGRHAPQGHQALLRLA
jgi:site-specific recombinase XerD